MTNHSTTINQREIAHFHQLAETWWDAEGPFWPLHRLNRLRVDWIVEQLCAQSEMANSLKPLSGLSVLDVGCGGGILSESLARLGARVTGIDVVEKNIAIAQTHAEQQQLDIEYRLISVEELRNEGVQYDVVFNMEVVEHVANLPLFMASCHELVKEGGATFVATINRNWLAWFVTVFGAEYVLRWLPKGTHHYSMLRKPSEIEAFLNADAFEVVRKAGVRVNPVNRSMSIIESLAINYMIYAEKQR
ncbi:hypothetical protein A3715_03615 [Oleiphilus sp. HI0009]|uniref:bifunctional 2-polyprenyl-6-hydroxyphenol methylase/3-demethylubiquinol 3-O-methyltransferase UbiG n=1 Tax=unclassified Oleiphilus TaxID=2631174 RepID=UPI0007C3652C|nr:MULTISPECIES: bifunctional 2-polyprenyl-6-hydroxyphenol methylase/3-demethylubiquinol 3-O-methyltransferase UbiG [unclassified Oleiphilus]KZX86011.1 hypothetical protein A3715_03615 [Oleiphilus sp. HI0009]KZY65606.1 hypothetical protein A3738_08260 [Oleiphilus sp. HI0066]KZY68004.1 hypothetical protein A3739_20675 [Oleiphilus sp. HI0067]KZY71922.1 hypothetical protein A3739_03830 [Oleiphilus sp. HI0067]